MGSQAITPNTEAAILSRLIQSREEMTAEVAEYLLSINFEAPDVERMNFLAERASAGALSIDEEKELDSYLHVGSLLSIMQSRARRRLKSSRSASFREGTSLL
jgi:hypothetical protein